MTIPYTENTAWQDGSGGGTPVSASKLNNIEQGITDAHLMPAARVRNSAAISIPNNVATVLTYDTERFDTVGGSSGAMHSTSSNTGRLTAQSAGKY
jgi:hypothetical protein